MQEDSHLNSGQIITSQGMIAVSLIFLFLGGCYGVGFWDWVWTDKNDFPFERWTGIEAFTDIAEQYYADAGKYPQSMEQMLRDGYVSPNHYVNTQQSQLTEEALQTLNETDTDGKKIAWIREYGEYEIRWERFELYFRKYKNIQESSYSVSVLIGWERGVKEGWITTLMASGHGSFSDGLGRLKFDQRRSSIDFPIEIDELNQRDARIQTTKEAIPASQRSSTQPATQRSITP